ncbi:hypothetical protein BISA_1372 [Bifidobacterium saguini DSM 23967]|uniref:Uncharacterized protein n=1 Tax=Bifidobacterium saguini DSM 23967 TaxID=1437607 RepID=A0A087DCF6_9BIFI|nr:hypothetical protein [Bifidobacterium saguini]KFI93206.1 hypothetical protein BISA_1372 [Bifidobacterium saguini DSM 23967]
MTGHWVEDETPPVILMDTRTPPMWDGVSMEWLDWTPPLTGFLCANNDLLKTSICPKCRHPWQPWWTRGHENGWKLKHHSRLQVDLERCGWCNLTLAISRWESQEPQEWVLDENDYKEQP